MKPSVFLSSNDNSFIDDMYQKYKEDPDNLDPSWMYFFDGFDYGSLSNGNGATSALSNAFQKELNVFRLIQSYRSRGHLLSNTNPIKKRIDRNARIDLETYNLETGDLEKEFECGRWIGLEKPTLQNIINHMHQVYCGKWGVEFTHCYHTDIRRFTREFFEIELPQIKLTVEKKKRILEKLNQANVFENFLQSKYIGQKRFSLEGGESAIVAIDALINHGAELGVKEFTVGMAHRGRLNMLANIFGKTYEFIFKEFEASYDGTEHGGGDVKYHKGFSSLQKTLNGKEVILKLMHNPSHLEAVAPVTCGFTRAQIDMQYHGDNSQICPIIIHGDAAVAGQGVVYETLQMSELPAYQCGGAIHFVINNQIGFTTDFIDGRSSHYATSVARTLEAPIIHVNGDCPESVVKVMEFAVAFRQKFKKDIFVDMVCYRKHGHNEGDEPKYTQPHLYGLVAKHKNPRELYIDQLEHEDKTSRDLAHKMQEEFKNLLSERLDEVRQRELPELKKGPHRAWLDFRWSKLTDFDSSPHTKVDIKILDKVINALTTYPSDFNILKKAKKIVEGRRQSFEQDQIDWGTAELLAYGTILNDGFDVRFSGQDVIRGTFSHRHAKLFDEKTNEKFCGLQQVSDKAHFYIYNSNLSEYAVLAFEFGYGLASPNSLNIWEAQFGDFANGAQIVIDQFVSSTESKWNRMCNLVMLLPHGYEGQGPEHSSARLERFLQMCAEENMIIVNCTTPANMFHALRRQQKFEFRKPMIAFTPKSLLRHPECVSSKKDFTEQSFKEILLDPEVDYKRAKSILFCTGKVFYDLVEHRREQKIKDVAIIRVEQLYPFPLKQFNQILSKISTENLAWVQEEPENMGAWQFLISRHPEIFTQFDLVARSLAASPAVGSAKKHLREFNDLMKKAFS